MDDFDNKVDYEDDDEDEDDDVTVVLTMMAWKILWKKEDKGNEPDNIIVAMVMLSTS